MTPKQIPNVLATLAATLVTIFFLAIATKMVTAWSAELFSDVNRVLERVNARAINFLFVVVN